MERKRDRQKQTKKRMRRERAFSMLSPTLLVFLQLTIAFSLSFPFFVNIHCFLRAYCRPCTLRHVHRAATIIVLWIPSVQQCAAFLLAAVLLTGAIDSFLPTFRPLSFSSSSRQSSVLARRERERSRTHLQTELGGFDGTNVAARATANDRHVVLLAAATAHAAHAPKRHPRSPNPAHCQHHPLCLKKRATPRKERKKWREKRREKRGGRRERKRSRDKMQQCT